MKRYGKRFLSLLIAVVMVLTTSVVMTVPIEATSKTVNDALAWCESQVGRALDYDGVYGAQCVDFIYYYYQYLGVSPVGGNASDYQYNTLPAGWQRFQGATPQPGDILVYANHVGVYASTSLMYHQAPSMGGYVMHDAHNYTYYNGYWGVIRPNFNQSTNTNESSNTTTSKKWLWPITGQIFGRGFGEHKAIDIVAPAGTTVVAAREGTVVCASTVSASASYYCPSCTYTGAGYHVVIRHPDGYYSFYDHLSSVSVTAGAYVNAGQKVGAVGSTGNSTGAHLHFAISSSGLYSLVDPLIYLTPFSSVTANVAANDVTMTGTFGAYGPTMQTAGFYIGTSKSNMTKVTETLNTDGYTNGVAIVNIFYSMSKWYPYLAKGNIYYYKMYITRDGKEYCSDIYSFTYGTHTHSWNSGSVTKAPTCTATGIKTYTCTECGATKTETVAAKGHTVVTVNGTPATCTSDGRTSGSKCSVCNAVLTAQETIAALGHSFGEWSVKKQASCTENGTESRTCASCGITEDRAIPAKGHSYISTEIPATPESQGYTLHECKECGDSYRDNYTDYINPNPNSPKAVIETKTAAPGDTVTVSIALENAPALKTLAIRDIVYDASKLELVGGKWNAEGAIIADWNQADKNAVLAFGQNTDVNGVIFTLTFKVLEEAEDAEVAVSCKLTAREKPENGEETEVDISTVSGAVKISSVKRGDVNGDGYVDSDDAIYMLRFIMIPDGYPINQNGDFNGDGIVDSDDAIYLLYHVLLPDRYLLK